MVMCISFLLVGFNVLFEAEFSIWLLKHQAKVLRYQFIVKAELNTMKT